MVNDWDSKVEKTNAFLASLAAAVKTFNIGKIGLETVKLTACSPESFTSQASDEVGYEVLVFPDGIAYSNMKVEHIESFVKSHLGEGQV
jgi:hypothetical protein